MTTYYPVQSGECMRINCHEVATFGNHGGGKLCAEHFKSWFHWYSKWMSDANLETYRKWWAELLDEPLPIREPRWRPELRWRQLTLPLAA